MSHLLRSELEFEGVAITDALDVKALDQGGRPAFATPVRDEARNVTFRLALDERMLALMPRPVDLTPAPRGHLYPVGHGL